MAENKYNELFGKNGKLVEYRKKQVLEGALGVIQRHYEGKPNKMEAVATMFGKKLGERFKVKRDNEVFDCAITRYGIYCFSAYENPYIDLNAFVLCDLLTGEAVIVDE